MSLIYVNQKEINGKVYTALRDDKDPKIQAIECDGVQKPCRLRDIWPFNNRIEALWQS